jgi:hypothetical protein
LERAANLQILDDDSSCQLAASPSMQSGFVRQKRHGQVGTHSDRSNDRAGIRIEASRNIQCNPNGGFRRPVDPFDRFDPLDGKGPRKPDAEEGVDDCD